MASLKRQYLLFYIQRLDGVDEIEIVRALDCSCTSLFSWHGAPWHGSASLTWPRGTLHRRIATSPCHCCLLLQFDLKTRRTFLKRTHYPTLKLEDIFIGAKLTMYGLFCVGGAGVPRLASWNGGFRGIACFRCRPFRRRAVALTASCPLLSLHPP